MEYKPYIPQAIDELLDQVGSMMLSSPEFKDGSGYFPDMSIDTEFLALNGGLRNLRATLGEDNYHVLIRLSKRMRGHFEAGPEGKTEETRKGRQIILEMEDLLTEIWAKQSKANSA